MPTPVQTTPVRVLFTRDLTETDRSTLARNLGATFTDENTPRKRTGSVAPDVQVLAVPQDGKVWALVAHRAPGETPFPSDEQWVRAELELALQSLG